MPDTQDEAYCQVFTRDAAFVVGNTLFVAGFRESYRRPELAGLASLLDQFPKVAVIDRGCLEGGDVVLLGPDLVLIGTNENSDQSGFDQASDRIRQDGISHVIQVRHGGLHLDCCLAPLPNGDGLFSPGRLSSDACDLLSSCFRRLVALDPEEDARHLAANLLWVDEETVVSNIHVPKTNALLRSLGFQVLAVDYTEAIHAWGSIRCTVCPLVRAN
ncbi:MAG: hypothetical protein HZA46_07545 [Planctomycetales bacterium]|nr:hypothetical protein [Planctomycetales bacterium]